MKPVGIIANPASGKDIRRLIASGMTVTNQEKQNLLIRMLLAMDALGVESVEIMPDTTGIGQRVIAEVQDSLKCTRVTILAMPYVIGTQNDSLRAAQQMAEREFACIVVLGGDGTSRIVSKGSGDVPLIPVSTGTNNAFPQMIEGTLVGMAAAAVVTGVVSEDEACDLAPRLELVKGSQVIDIALIDLAVVDARDIAARAVWEPDTLKEIFLTQASPASIGLSSIGGQLHPLRAFHQPGYSACALQIVVGKGNHQVLAPIAPGLMKRVPIERFRLFSGQEDLRIGFSPGVVALDGEREVAIAAGEHYGVRLNPHGPKVVNITRTLGLATEKNMMVTNCGECQPFQP